MVESTKKASTKAKAKGAKAAAKPKKAKATKARAKKSAPVEDLPKRASATLRAVRVSPRKMRLEINLIKGRQVEPALQILRHSPRKTSRIARKLLESAIANAREAKGLDVDRLWITDGWVNTGVSLWRFMPRAQGRATPIQKRSSHVTIVLGEK